MKVYRIRHEGEQLFPPARRIIHVSITTEPVNDEQGSFKAPSVCNMGLRPLYRSCFPLNPLP